MIPVDSQILRAIAPSVGGQKAHRQAEIISEVGDVLQSTLERYDITTASRISHFWGRPATNQTALTPPRSTPAARFTKGEGTSATCNRAMAPGTRDAVCCN